MAALFDTLIANSADCSNANSAIAGADPAEFGANGASLTTISELERNPPMAACVKRVNRSLFLIIVLRIEIITYPTEILAAQYK
jgi:hypothetical protein